MVVIGKFYFIFFHDFWLKFFALDFSYFFCHHTLRRDDAMNLKNKLFLKLLKNTTTTLRMNVERKLKIIYVF